MNVFDNVFAYVTVEGRKGIVRADSKSDAEDRVRDYYPQDEPKILVPLCAIDNDHGVITDESIKMEIDNRRLVRRFAVDIIDSPESEGDIAMAVENALGVQVIKVIHETTWTYKYYVANDR